MIGKTVGQYRITSKLGAGYRDSRPIPVSAVYVAPPFNPRKERFKSVSTPVIRQAGDSFDPGLLAGFVAALRQAKEAN